MSSYFITIAFEYWPHTHFKIKSMYTIRKSEFATHVRFFKKDAHS